MAYHPVRNSSGGTFRRCAVDHRVLRELFRHLQAFEALHETEGIDAITGPDGTTYSIYDLRRLYDSRLRLLPPRRAQAIEFFLYRDMREQDAAVAMKLPPETPVAIYATQGLKQLAAEWESPDQWQRGGRGGSQPQSDAAPVRHMPGAGVPGRRADTRVA